MVSSSEAERNVILEACMKAAGLTANDLAERMNDVLLARTGRSGELTDRTIRRLLSGQTRWPQSRQRLALEAVFGSTAEELGFIPTKPRRPEEDPVLRRSFLAATAAAASSLTVSSPHGRVGESDVIRLRASLDSLSASDDRDGGSEKLERFALLRAEQAIELLQTGQMSSRVREKVYGVASEAMNYAAWFALDAGETDRARRHLDRALTQAGLSGDAVITLATWDNISVTSFRGNNFADAEAASRRARSTPLARRDPLFSSLCHVRSALANSRIGATQSALRSLGNASEALSKSGHEERPRWSRFYDAAELNGLSGIVHLQLGRPGAAEYHIHNTLSRIRPDLVRNRAYYSVHLAIAQLKQGELELACSTADKLLSRELPGSVRIQEVLRNFRTEAAAIGSAETRSWLKNTALRQSERNA